MNIPDDISIDIYDLEKNTSNKFSEEGNNPNKSNLYQKYSTGLKNNVSFCEACYLNQL